jgi:hypothetical protein
VLLLSRFQTEDIGRQTSSQENHGGIPPVADDRTVPDLLHLAQVIRGMLEQCDPVRALLLRLDADDTG